MATEKMTFQYEIEFKNGRKKEFTVELDPETLALVPQPHLTPPEWAKLVIHRCENCPLDPDAHPYCPVALSLTEVVKAFSGDPSYEEVNVTIRTPPRTYRRTIALQDALRSLFGIYMVSSGCPVFNKLRPLVQMHLPFSTMKETAFRALSMYVLAQFFIQRKGGTPDMSLEGLGKIYQEIEIVNRGLHQRLVTAKLNDACLNAIGNLNCYALFTQMFLAPGKLEQIEKLFTAYLK